MLEVSVHDVTLFFGGERRQALWQWGKQVTVITRRKPGYQRRITYSRSPRSMMADSKLEKGVSDETSKETRQTCAKFAWGRSV